MANWRSAWSVVCHLGWIGAAASSEAAAAVTQTACSVPSQAAGLLWRWHGPDQVVGMVIVLLCLLLVAAGYVARSVLDPRLRLGRRRGAAGEHYLPTAETAGNTELVGLRQDNQALQQQVEALQAAQSRMAAALRDTRQLLTPALSQTGSLSTAAVDTSSTALQQRGVERLLGLLDQLIPLATASRRTLPESEALILHAWLLPRLDLWREAALAQGLDWRVQMLPDVALSTHSRLLDETLHTLFDSAIQTCRPGGEIHFQVQVLSEPGALSLQLDYQATPSLPGESDAQALALRLLQQRWLAQGGDWSTEARSEGQVSQTLQLPCHWTPLVSLQQPHDVVPMSVSSEEAPLLLVVEPDPDLQQLLVSWLTPSYRVSVSSSLRGGLLAAREQEPALVLCEQQLPDGDGYTLLESLKSDAETSHLPVVICGGSQDAVQMRRAWHHRADDFLGKPFEPAVLQLRLRALLENRRMLREWLSSQLLSAPSRWQGSHEQESDARTLSRQEQQFGERLRQSTLQLLQQDQASVEQLASDFGMSARSLQRKLRALYGLSYSDYVRTLQLQLVMETLQCGGSVKEAAGLAGFKDQAYLTRVFKQQFDMTPSQFKKQCRGEGVGSVISAGSVPAEMLATALAETGQLGE